MKLKKTILQRVFQIVLLSGLFTVLFGSCDLFEKKEKTSSNNRTIIKEYHPNGKIKSINEVIGEKRDGLCKYYNTEGKLIATTEFKNNMYHGKYTTYYSNNKKCTEVTYASHEKNGTAINYYENGKIAIEENYLKGELNGIKKKYHGNGLLMMENEFKNGQPSINLKEYDAYGKIKTNYPSIIIEGVDRVLLEQQYILYVSFSDKSRSAEFYIGELDDNKFLPAHLPEYATTNGVAKIEMPVPPGTVIMKTITIIGKKRTTDGNSFVTTKKYNLAVKN
jgi:hypothetical protein